jgi:16S rRNA (guanine966-N2)-methyltransferase
MRVIAGNYKGRNIDCPKGNRIRPTSDMVRTAVFNILNTRVDIEEANVLDVFCGTGAYGIEALSRGGKFVGFIDNHRESLDTTRHNIGKMHQEKNYKIYGYDAEKLPKADIQYNVILIDPPYKSGFVPKTLAALKAGDWIAPDALIVAEEGELEEIKLPEGFEFKSERRYGNTKVYLIAML